MFASLTDVALPNWGFCPKEKMEELLPCVPIHLNGLRAWGLTENLMVIAKISYNIVLIFLIVYSILIQLVPSCPK